jgi:hypothetical protein
MSKHNQEQAERQRNLEYLPDDDAIYRYRLNVIWPELDPITVDKVIDAIKNAYARVEARS